MALYKKYKDYDDALTKDVNDSRLDLVAKMEVLKSVAYGNNKGVAEAWSKTLKPRSKPEQIRAIAVEQGLLETDLKDLGQKASDVKSTLGAWKSAASLAGVVLDGTLAGAAEAL